MWQRRERKIAVDLDRNVEVTACGKVYGAPCPPGFVAPLGYEAQFHYSGPARGLYRAYERWCTSGDRVYVSRAGGPVEKPRRYILGTRFVDLVQKCFPEFSWADVLAISEKLRTEE